MRCKTVLSRLDDHVDGVLAVAESAAIREHLDACGECRDAALAANASSSVLAAWDDVEPPADGYERVLARLEALPVEAFERRPTPRPGAFHVPSMDVHRYRRIATGGLAAAAAVLGALVVTKADAPRAVRHAGDWGPNKVALATPVSWFQGYQFDDGLYRQRAGRAPLRPFGVESDANEQLVGSPR